jgi:uncharacterized protein
MRPSEALARHRDAIRVALARYPVSDPRIFGSTSRGEDDEASDLDILVRSYGGLSYLDLARLETELEALTGVRVDVRTEGEFSPSILSQLSRDCRPL